MPGRYSSKEGRALVLVLAIIFLFILWGARHARANPLAIGIVAYVSIHVPVVEGFKAGMTEFGYKEGEDVEYIYNGILEGTIRAIDAEINALLDKGVDLILPVGNLASIRAKEVSEIDVPIIFCATTRPVEAGIVKSIRRPGANITGVKVANHDPKALEWLSRAIPGAKKFFLPYNPEDVTSVMHVEYLGEIQNQLGIELVFHKVYSVKEAAAIIETLPEDIEAVFRIPSPTLDPGNEELSRACIKKCLPMGASLPLNESVLLTFGADLFNTGKQASRLAYQIQRGIKPSDLPVETSESFLTINLKTAEKIGLEIPYEILLQADKIIR